MVCPHCHLQYAASSPISANPVVDTAHEKPAPLYPAPQKVAVCSNSTRGNRID
jgi:hypothetical protein